MTAPMQPADELLLALADYALDYRPSAAAREAARLCLMDALACAMQALAYPACARLLGPIVPGAVLPGGARVPGTGLELDPVQAAFNFGAMIRWLDYNDTWLAAEWAHPSDNLAAVLSAADYASRTQGSDLSMRAVLDALVKAYEIQGVLALNNSFNAVGLDHVILVRIASCAVTAALLAGTREQVVNAISNAWLDGGVLRSYRHAPNTGSRKSWAAGDAAARGVFHALLALRGEMGYPQALTAPRWGFHDVVLRGKALALTRPLGSYVIENILFKIAYPAEFHAQTAAEAAIVLHPEVAGRFDAIVRIDIETTEPAMRIIDKRGDLRNPADRDHCLQYVTAVSLLHGALSAEDYEDAVAFDPRIDALREIMQVRENSMFSCDYYDPGKRAIGNAVQVFFRDGSATPRVAVEYPIGHPRRRAEALPLLNAKFERSVAERFAAERSARLREMFVDQDRLEALPVDDFMKAWVEAPPG